MLIPRGVRNTLILPLLPVFLFWGSGCGPADGSSAPVEVTSLGTLSFERIATPALEGAQTPSLHTSSEGVVLLSWVEPNGEGGHALRFSRLEDSGWSPPKTIAEGEDWFVNWADFPALISLGGDTLAAHYLAKSSPETYAYDVVVTQSTDGGETWGTPVRPHTDGTETEHGFVSMLSTDDGRLFVTWLDGRNTAGDGHGDQSSGGGMTLRAATLDGDAGLADEILLDDLVCDCCQTSAATISGGLAVAYRDRTVGEIRDIAVVRLRDGVWSAPKTVHQDGWEINGCPVNGPVIVAEGDRLAVAWFTSATGVPRVKFSISSDGGESFGSPIQIDDGRPVGRVHAVLLPDGSAVVSWIERTDAGAEIRVRRVSADGTPEEISSTVGAVTGARKNGFPRMTVKGDLFYIAWTDVGNSTSIGTAMATFSQH